MRSDDAMGSPRGVHRGGLPTLIAREEAGAQS
jgi:hypothetical protein